MENGRTAPPSVWKVEWHERGSPANEGGWAWSRDGIIMGWADSADDALRCARDVATRERLLIETAARIVSALARTEEWR